MRKELTTFRPEDGHIESVLIGIGQAKVCFQTWDCRKLVLLYFNTDKIISKLSCADISEYRIEYLDNSRFKYIFYGAEECVPVLTIKAESVKVYEVGINADINAALFDVGMEYIGNQVLDIN